MAMKRRMTHIPPMDSVCQLLVELQVAGHLDGVELPGWATGTSVEEAFKAVRYIGDAEWLDGVYDGFGPQESADIWLENFLNGNEVPNMDDAAAMVGNPNADTDEDDEEEGEVDKVRDSIHQFLATLPRASAERFKKRFEEDEEFEAAARSNLTALSVAMASTFAADEAQFSEFQSKFTFLDPLAIRDPDLLNMSKFILIDNVEDFLNSIDLDDATLAMARKRIKAITAKFKKAQKTAAKA